MYIPIIEGGNEVAGEIETKTMGDKTMANTKNPVRVEDYDALISEIENANQPNKVKVARLQKVWNQMRDAAWSTSHEAWAKEVRYKAYDLAQKFGGF